MKKNEADIINRLKDIKYPGLDKNIVELKTIESLKISGKNIELTLNLANEKAFALLEPTIKDLLKEFEVDIKLKTKKRSINYGDTSNPNNRAPYAKNVIAVTSGKGGVGKSTVSVNISVALAQKGFRVGLLDADVYGPDVPRMTQTAHERLRWNDNDKIVPSENFGIKIMSVGLTTPTPDTPLVWRSSVAVSALIQFLEDVEWGELDFLVIDMPPGTGDIQLTMAQELPITAAVLVTTPQNVSADDVSRAVVMFKDIGVKIAGVVENMSYFIAPDTKKRYHIFGEGAGENLCKRYRIPFLGKIPISMEIRELSDTGTPPVASGSEEIKKIYKNLVEEMLKNVEFNL